MRFNASAWVFSVLAISVLAGGDDPGALVIPASEYFEGNDGPWSTFDLRVGKPEQHVRVLVSTASPQSMVIDSELGCSDGAFDKVPPDCAVSRGTLFNRNDSDTWKAVGRYEINGDGVGLEANLGYSLTAEYGFDELAMGLKGPRLEKQGVAVFATPEPFYLGILGLNNQPVNFSVLGNSTTPSFIASLKDKNVIPSLSWSYTAGAKYRLKQVYGQLIFSGYDSSRFSENTVSFSLAEDLTRDIVVGLQSISYSGSQSRTLLSNAIDIYIDSTDPHLWLPEDVCDKFEEAFGLKIDENSGLYLINETHRDDLRNSDAEVTFRLSDDKNGGDTVSITLPYAAFDLKVKSPLVEEESYYFPLKRAANATQYTLGRVFLQEAYLSVDYERRVFNVSGCTWNSGAEENVITITSKDADSNGKDDDRNGHGGNNSHHGSSPDGTRLSGGEIAGIVIGSIAGFCFLVAAVAFLVLRWRRRKVKQSYEIGGVPPTPDMTMIGGPAHNSGMPYSSADVSGWTPSDGSSHRPITLAALDKNHSSSPPELDGDQTLLRPNTELDGREVPIGRSETTGKPKVFELAGSSVDPDRLQEPPSAVSSSPLNRVSDESPPSPNVSTMGTAWGRDERPDSDLVSPTAATHSGRPY